MKLQICALVVLVVAITACTPRQPQYVWPDPRSVGWDKYSRLKSGGVHPWRGANESALVLGRPTYETVKACDLKTGQVKIVPAESFGHAVFDVAVHGHPNCIKAAEEAGLRCGFGRCLKVPDPT